MKKSLITLALVASFLILCFGGLLAGDPREAHTWDERTNGIVQKQVQEGPQLFSMAVVPLGKSYVLIWRGQLLSSQRQGTKLGGFGFYVLRNK